MRQLFTRITGIALAHFAWIATCAVASAQCFEWTNRTDLPGFVASGPPLHLDGQVRALEVFDGKLVAAGEFANVGGTPTSLVAEWNGSAWAAIPLAGVTVTNQGTAASALLATGSDLFVGGLKTEDNGWTRGFVCRAGAVPAFLGFFTYSDDKSFAGEVRVFANYGGSLYAAGRFDSGCIRRYAGSWTTLGQGVHNGAFLGNAPIVDALAVFDDGSGAKLYAGGYFLYAGSVSVPGLARWDGASWQGVDPPAGIGSWTALTVFDAGTGPALFAAGSNATTSVVARYDGASWSIVGNANGKVLSLAVFDDGAGRALYAGGAFSTLDGVQAKRIAKWNGTGWSALDSGVASVGYPAPEVYALEGFARGSGSPALYVGGAFNRAGADVVQNIAAWRHCVDAGTPYCFGDGSLPTPCPCAPPDTVPNPSGSPGFGCANSIHSSGAKLFASGTTSPDTIRLHGASQTPGGFTILISGNGSEANGVAYGDGVRCAGGQFVRFAAQNATGGSVVYPSVALGLTQPLHVVSGVTPGSGQTRYYQALYRDVAASFCSSGTFNLGSAVSLVW